MHWAEELFIGPSITHTLLLLSAVIAAGIALGRVRLLGISFGVASVLFTGLVAGHLHPIVNEEMLSFARELGLILFVYTIGIQVGPGFFASFRRHGLRLNGAAIAIVLMNVGLAATVHITGCLPLAATVGILSGAVTNTPSMAAAQQAIRSRIDLPPGAEQTVGLGYAIAYPMGVLGTILTMVLIRRWFRINPAAEAEQYAATQARAATSPANLNIEVKNPRLTGQPVQTLSSLVQADVAISRLLRDGHIRVPRPSTRLQLGDVLHAVGAPADLEKLRIAASDPAPVDLRAMPSNLTTRYVLVTQRDALGHPLADLDLGSRYEVVITRIARAGIEFVPNPSVQLQFGDRVTIVGEESAIKKVAVELGDSPKDLNQPNILPIFIGILLGVVAGSIPIALPGVPAPVKLGLAGGPLVVAMLLARIGRIGPVIWFMPQSANLLLREIGIALFLACVGLRAGDRFLAILTQPQGWLWMLWGAMITIVPMLIVAVVARLRWRMNYGSLCGLLAGSMTDPPALAFAGSTVPSEAPIITYASVYPLVTCLRVLLSQILVFSLIP